MYNKLFLIIFAGILMTGNALADDQIRSAMSAAPASVSANAKVIDWNFKTLREGNNGWTCLPDRPDTPGNDPWCVNEPWLNFLKAYVKKEKPTYTEIGFAYNFSLGSVGKKIVENGQIFNSAQIKSRT